MGRVHCHDSYDWSQVRYPHGLGAPMANIGQKYGIHAEVRVFFEEEVVFFLVSVSMGSSKSKDSFEKHRIGWGFYLQVIILTYCIMNVVQ